MFQQPLSRRDWLRRSTNGFGSLALAAMCAEATARQAQANPLAPKAPHFAPHAKRVIFLFMRGGPSQVDTFDYKPELMKHHGVKAAKSYNPMSMGRADMDMLFGSPFKFTQHGQSGQWVSELFPSLAKHADDLCIVNSMHCDSPAHDLATVNAYTGFSNSVRPSLGAWVQYGLGSESQDLPGYVVLGRPTGLFAQGESYNCAFLPAFYQGTVVEAAGGGLPDIVNSRLSSDEQRRQLDMVQAMNRRLLERAHVDPQIESVIESYELGFRMQSVVPEIMNLGRESAETLAMYGIKGDAGLVQSFKAEKITLEAAKQAYNESFTFGRQCLIARRMAEAGVRFIQLTTGFRWDHHKNLPVEMPASAAATDMAIAGLLTDLKQRDMLKDTLVVWGGEFGRTPTTGIFSKPGAEGRDHNHRAFTIWMAGGGVKGGLRYGATDEFGGIAVENKVHTHDLHATILHLLGLDHRQLKYRYAGRDYTLTDLEGRVINDVIA